MPSAVTLRKKACKLVLDRRGETELARFCRHVSELRIAHLAKRFLALPAEQIVAAEIGASRTRQHLTQQDRLELLRGIAQFVAGGRGFARGLRQFPAATLCTMSAGEL